MKTKKKNEVNGEFNFTFSKPAIYQIKVQGDLPETWSDSLGGMQITVSRKTGEQLRLSAHQTPQR